MSLHDDLVAAKALIDTPEKWAHESKSRVTEGGSCLCAIDAMTKANGETFHKLHRVMTRCLPSNFSADDDNELDPIAQFNDAPTTTHADVMALFQRAIDAAEKSESGA